MPTLKQNLTHAKNTINYIQTNYSDEKIEQYINGITNNTTKWLGQLLGINPSYLPALSLKTINRLLGDPLSDIMKDLDKDEIDDTIKFFENNKNYLIKYFFAIQYLEEQNATNIEPCVVPEFFNFGPCFIIIGANEDFKPDDHTSWGENAVICDLVHLDYFPAVDIKKHLSKQKISLSDNLSTNPQTEPKKLSAQKVNIENSIVKKQSSYSLLPITASVAACNRSRMPAMLNHSLFRRPAVVAAGVAVAAIAYTIL